MTLNEIQPKIKTLNVVIGRELGYDYATYGLTLPENPPQIFMEGYNAQKHQQKSIQKVDTYTKRLIRLKYSAWSRNRSFDPTLTADYLKSITTTECPIIRKPFTWGDGSPESATVDRAFNDAGYAKGNLIYISRKANIYKGSKSFEDFKAIYDLQHSTKENQQIFKDHLEHSNLTVDEFNRLFYLSYITSTDNSKIYPMYFKVPQTLDIQNVGAAIQLLVSLGQAFSKLKNSRYQNIHKYLSTLNGKKSTKLFQDFGKFYSALLIQQVKSKSIHHAIADSWNTPITAMYAKWLNSLGDGITELLPALHKVAIAGEYTHWDIESKGYYY